MTMASEIERLQEAKADIKTSIEWKWVSVPSSAKLDTYDSYIDQIQQGLPQEDYDTIASVWKWAALGYPYMNSTTSHDMQWWNSYLCKIGNYIFMIWWFSEHFSSGTRDYFNWYTGILYKLEWASSWSRCELYFKQLIATTSTTATVNLTPVYVESTNTINIHWEVIGRRWEKAEAYMDWVIWNNAITISQQATWQDINNYKIYNSHIDLWEINAGKEVYAVWYMIDDPLL